jgi:hypothetical protein
MLILGVLLLGCDKDTQQQNDKTLTGQVSNSVPSEEKPDRDWSQPYQVMPIGDALIKMPNGYFVRVDKERVILQARLVPSQAGVPKFLTIDEARKAAPFDTYNTVYVNVSKSDLNFKKGTSALDERSVLGFVAFLGYYPTPPEILTTLGLKAYRSRSGLNYLYFPLDTNFRKPNGEVFYLDCDKTPTDPKAVESCKVGFIPKDNVSVSYSFPPQYLRYWKEIHQFVLNTLQFTN